MDQLTVAERYKIAIRSYREISDSIERKDSPTYQSKLASLIQEFTLILKIIDNLSLFSENETIDEITTNYIPFLNVQYYIGDLYTSSLMNKNGEIDIGNKLPNLTTAKDHIINYLIGLSNYKILNKPQSDLVNILKRDPNTTELTTVNPTTRRQEKIENFKYERELTTKLKILDEYYSSKDDENNEFSKLDEEIVREIFIDQIRLYALKSFNLLQSISMESQVLKSMPAKTPSSQQPSSQVPEDKRAPTRENDYGFTTRLESLPQSTTNKISDFLSGSGKILKPFTITSERQRLKDKVMGTGQVLPSMTVEEYLDYELKNGKLMKDEVKDKPQGSEDEEELDSDEELEKRRWDDWKDENPKGAGNMGANIG
ncbi:TAP42 [[Candida] subhashii]|uniref:TAP42 n=1 Tax=[Candida] subhashii TaxID=561895 RepID=A0A8J5QRP6_9ASCO|nr:TAP42 [[Candida] subhashii]KAG7665205.1 TAP42 [[Candida] subhashii]